MKAGKLGQRATVWRAAPTIDRNGQDDDTYEPLATYWCEELTTAGIERVLGAGTIAEATKALQFRGRLDIKPGDRLAIGNRTIELTQVINPDGKGIAIVCVGKERQTS